MSDIRFNLGRDGAFGTITTAQRAGGSRKPRTRTIALTDCVCTDRNGNVIKVIARTASTRTRKPNRRTNAIPALTRSDITLMATMGSIHEGAH